MLSSPTDVNNTGAFTQPDNLNETHRSISIRTDHLHTDSPRTPLARLGTPRTQPIHTEPIPPETPFRSIGQTAANFLKGRYGRGARWAFFALAILVVCYLIIKELHLNV